MKAAQIIELIKKFPPEERTEIAAFLAKENASVAEPGANYAAGPAPAERKIRYISKEKFDEIMPKIFEKHEELFRRPAQRAGSVSQLS